MTRYDAPFCHEIDKDHQYGEVEFSRFGGNPVRHCTECRAVLAYWDDEE